MLVMSVMRVRMFVLEGQVVVPVLVPLGEVQPHARPHQHSRQNQRRGQRCTEHHGERRANEGRQGEVGARACRTQAAQQASGERTDPLLDDCLQRLIALAGDEPLADEPMPAAEPAAASATLDEPLTRKEIRVLQLLAEGYSNSVMAEKLFVSDSTVRTHLRNINMKLNAHSRTQAVAPSGINSSLKS